MNPSRGALWNIWVQKGCFCSLAQEQIKYPVSSSCVLATLVDHGREENKKGHHEGTIECSGQATNALKR